ncbi:hypothetical protein NXX53_11230 [Bacteroides salyersiae]|nr:hypothetical protein [Bacteroides salyersiae]
MNSEFGNLLLLKGKNAPASAEGPASTGDLGKGWFSLNFIGPASAEGGNDYRVTYQMKMVSDLEIGAKKLGLSCVSGGGNNTSLGSKSEVLFYRRLWLVAISNKCENRNKRSFPCPY